MFGAGIPALKASLQYGVCQSANLPDGWVLEIHMEKGLALLGLFPPNGVRQDFDTTGTTMADQMLKAIALAKNATNASPECESVPAKGRFPSKGESQ